MNPIDGTLPKLPRAIEADPRRGALEAKLAEGRAALWERGTLGVTSVALSPTLERALIRARDLNRLERGIERIAEVLDAEKKGIDAVRAREGTEPARRISRLLLVTDDGAERFYRECERALLAHGDRVLGLRLGASSTVLGGRLFGPDRAVKALLVADRDAVVEALFSLLA